MQVLPIVNVEPCSSQFRSKMQKVIPLRTNNTFVQFFCKNKSKSSNLKILYIQQKILDYFPNPTIGRFYIIHMIIVALFLSIASICKPIEQFEQQDCPISNKKQIQQLKRQVDQLKKVVQSLTNSVTSQDKQIFDLKKVVQSLNYSVTIQGKSISEFNTAVIQQGNIVSHLNLTVQSTNLKLAQLSGTVAGLITSVNSIPAKQISNWNNSFYSVIIKTTIQPVSTTLINLGSYCTSCDMLRLHVQSYSGATPFLSNWCLHVIVENPSRDYSVCGINWKQSAYAYSSQQVDIPYPKNGFLKWYISGGAGGNDSSVSVAIKGVRYIKAYAAMQQMQQLVVQQQ